MLTTKVRDSRIGAVLQLIERQPAYSIREVADEIHLSSGKLRRMFKQETGVHIGDYMIEQRLQKAAQLLTTSGLSIKEITDAVGYEHHSSFTRAFKHRFGKTPKLYRLQSYTDSISMPDVSINESDHQ